MLCFCAAIISFYLLGLPLIGFVAENHSVRLAFVIGLPLLIFGWIFVYIFRTKILNNYQLQGYDLKIT